MSEEMPVDPIKFVSLIKQCNAREEAKQYLLEWLKRATLLLCQANGQAVSAQLSQVLIDEFPALLKTIAEVDTPDNNAAAEQLFIQVQHFYSWLSILSAKATAQLSGLPCADATGLNGASIQPLAIEFPDTCDSHEPEFDKYD